MAAINIYSPSEDDKAGIVHGIIEATGRPVEFISTSGLVACPVCSGNDPFCPTCQGNPTVDLEYRTTLTAAVRWKGGEQKSYRPGHQVIDGDCQVVIILASGVEDMLRQTRSVIVDNRRCVINSWYRKGAPPNRIHVVLKEDEDLEGHRVG